MVQLADHPGRHCLCFPRSALSHLPMRYRVFAERSNQITSDWFRSRISVLGFGKAIAQLCDVIAPHVFMWDQHRLTQLITLAYHLNRSTHIVRATSCKYVEQQRVALPSEAQVKVMTIHSSKVLNSTLCFCPIWRYRFGTSSVDGGPSKGCMQRHPDGVLRYMNEKYKRSCPSNGRRPFIIAENKLSREVLCVLYVAMTRARSAL